VRCGLSRAPAVQAAQAHLSPAGPALGPQSRPPDRPRRCNPFDGSRWSGRHPASGTSLSGLNRCVATTHYALQPLHTRRHRSSLHHGRLLQYNADAEINRSSIFNPSASPWQTLRAANSSLRAGAAQSRTQPCLSAGRRRTDAATPPELAACDSVQRAQFPAQIITSFNPNTFVPFSISSAVPRRRAPELPAGRRSA